MAHMIDTTTGRPAIAYVGETPWHGMGRALTAGASLETWRTEAGLDYSVERAPIVAVPADGSAQIEMPSRHVLYRSDTRRPLSVVSRDYRVVQPGQVLDFFAEMVKQNGFELETAGALDGGKRVWALARVDDGRCILDADMIRPYVLFATSYDGSMATTAKFTSVRVVCHNTLTMAAGHADRAQSEVDAVGGCVKVPHSSDFDAKKTRLDLGIVFDHYERFMSTARRLALQPVDDAFAAQFLKMLLPPVAAPTPDAKRQPKPLEETVAYRSIIDLFHGGAIGSDLPEAKGTAFGLLNAVTEYVDHVRGGDGNRLSSAWFGNGGAMKDSALRLLSKAVAA